MENNNKQTISIPVAIVIAGVLIMISILATKTGGEKAKTLSEQVGVNKEKFAQCMKEINLDTLLADTTASADKAMSALPEDQRGTPYSVIIGKNGAKAEIKGAQKKETVDKLIAEVKAGKVTNEYKGEIPAYQDGEHIIGNPDAPIMVIEYSDLECPYCKRFGGVMKEVVAESNGDVAWVYRHWVVHQGAIPKTGAAECVARLKGNEAFWKYIDLVFGLMKTEEDTSATDIL